LSAFLGVRLRVFQTLIHPIHHRKSAGETIASAEYSCKVAKGRVIRPFRSWFDADFVVDGESELLLAAEVLFRCLDGYMAEEKLNLVELATGQVTEARTCPPEIVRCQLVYPGSLSGSLDDLPKHFGRYTLAPDLS
jgi:hypothetical protein